MNFYPHHIGDFNNATRHLTRVERSVYRDLIELYYDTEQPLTLDLKALCRKVLARSDEEATAVEQVLNEFFTETEQGWHQERCEKEILKYHGNIESKSAAGRASAAKRAGKVGLTPHKGDSGSTDVQQPFNGCSTNQEPVTINQEPVTIKNIDAAASASVGTSVIKFDASKKSASARAKQLQLLEGIAPQIASDFISIREAKKSPLTETAVRGIQREAAKVGYTLEQALTVCCERGWVGFKAEWITKDQVGGMKNKQVALEESNRAATAGWIPPEMRGQHAH